MSRPGRLRARANYYRRIAHAYLGSRPSQLTFWHETPALNERAFPANLRQYYMTFREKADYSAHLDEAEVPLLDYGGSIGLQYNPIAIAQYGLANLNLVAEPDGERRARAARASADWLAENLVENGAAVPVWMHHFDWEYRTKLEAPWYSGLAQGQGISLLVRAAVVLDQNRYLDAADRAYEGLTKEVGDGGVLFVRNGQTWIEEYLVTPPTHILNGLMWALWGVWDYVLARNSSHAHQLFGRCVTTLEENLHLYDSGSWSLYELSGTRLPMVASSFYHRLHIVQLRVMHRLTHSAIFETYADRWLGYWQRPWYRRRAAAQKAVFKLAHY